MKYIEPGVVGNSWLDFTIPSDFAKSALYCCPQTGHFYCTDQYKIDRESHDWFLFCYIVKGTLCLSIDGSEHSANANEILLVDGRKPHTYQSKGNCEFMWFHFFGNSSCAYVDYLLAGGSCVFTGSAAKNMKDSFSNILHIAGGILPNEHLISRNISNILCSLAVSQKNSTVLKSPVQPALQYIFEHFHEQIDLDQMAELCGISKPHLIRCFRSELNCTPHEFLLYYRLRQSKLLLSNTTFSVEVIAEKCGFNSVSHFSRAFKGKTDMTPSDFRKLW